MTPWQLALLLELAKHPDKTILIATYRTPKD